MVLMHTVDEVYTSVATGAGRVRSGQSFSKDAYSRQQRRYAHLARSTVGSAMTVATAAGSASPFLLPLTAVVLDPGATRPWYSAYHGQQCADGRQSLPDVVGYAVGCCVMACT